MGGVGREVSCGLRVRFTSCSDRVGMPCLSNYFVFLHGAIVGRVNIFSRNVFVCNRSASLGEQVCGGCGAVCCPGMIVARGFRGKSRGGFELL